MNSLIKQDYKISQTNRNEANGHKTFVVWFTGLSGSGKSTLANDLEIYLFQKGIKTYVLDGDNTRLGINKDLDFSEQGRKENIRRVAEIAKLMNDAGLVVITSFISPYQQDRETAKQIIGLDKFVEVYVDCPLQECEKRDVKGLYARARKGEIKNFTGIDSPFEPPENPDIIIETHKSTREVCLQTISKVVETKL